MKKFVIGIFLFFCIIAGVLIGNILHQNNNKKISLISGVANFKASTTPFPTPGIPETIFIPRFSLTAPIEQVGLDTQGRMDIPTNPMNTGWFDKGFRPGANGDAVIDGHYDLVTGAPSIFWKIKDLAVGDSITVTDQNKRTYTFVVTKTIAYPYNNVPLKDIFASSPTPHLNLITCSGTWDKINKNYSQRKVVYADLKE